MEECQRKNSRLLCRWLRLPEQHCPGSAVQLPISSLVEEFKLTQQDKSRCSKILQKTFSRHRGQSRKKVSCTRSSCGRLRTDCCKTASYNQQGGNQLGNSWGALHHFTSREHVERIQEKVWVAEEEACCCGMVSVWQPGGLDPVGAHSWLLVQSMYDILPCLSKFTAGTWLNHPLDNSARSLKGQYHWPHNQVLRALADSIWPSITSKGPPWTARNRLATPCLCRDAAETL